VIRALGLDVGGKRIGVAFGDTETRVAVPLGVISRTGTEADLKAVIQRAQSAEVDLIVVGMPWSLDGSSGPQASLVNAFMQQLQDFTSVPLDKWDERFTSVEADRRLREVQLKRNPRRVSLKKSTRLLRGTQDAVAATIMLQAYLDAKNFLTPVVPDHS
jgi:putative Holliday junction resolvase